MTYIVTIGGSPSHPSRTAALLTYAQDVLTAQSVRVDHIAVRDLDAEALIQGRYDSEALKPAFAQVAAADALVIATPVYKAAYTGVLKAFLDLIPTNGLKGKVVLPIAIGGSLAHSLVIDYALRPVLAALGTTQVLPALYLIDSQVLYQSDSVTFDSQETEARIRAALNAVFQQVQP